MRGIACALIALLLATPAMAAGFDWPGGRKAAVVLSYDDSLPSHLDVAAPQLEAAGFRGTFFLNGTFAPADLPRWRRLSAAGHELGNHSMFHPCPRAFFEMEPQYHSEGYSSAGMLREIGAMNTMLLAIDGKPSHTYALPCSVSLAGGADYLDALRASGLARYVRSGVPADAVVRDPASLDPFRVPSRSFPETATAADLIAFVTEIERSGGMGVFTFHGVGGDYLRVSAEAHRGLLRYLQERRSDIWVAPFDQVMDHAIRARRRPD